MGQKVTQSVQLEVWALKKPADLFKCLTELVAQGYRGQVRCFPVDGNPQWDVEVGHEDKPHAPVTGVLGHVLVLFGGALESMTSEAYESRFGS
jgi:hypothetical protein